MEEGKVGRKPGRARFKPRSLELLDGRFGRGVLMNDVLAGLTVGLIALPLADKLKIKSKLEVLHKEIIIRGVIAIQSGDNPRIVEQKLRTFLPPAARRARVEAIVRASRARRWRACSSPARRSCASRVAWTSCCWRRCASACCCAPTSPATPVSSDATGTSCAIRCSASSRW